MTNAAFWNELKLIVRGRVFFLPRMADQRKVKLFSSIIFLSLCFKKKQEVVLQICHCIYSHKFHSIYVDDIRNTDLSRIIISLLWFVLRVNSSRSLWIKRFIYKPLDLLYFFVHTRSIYDQKTTLLCELWLLITSHHPVKFSSDRLRGSKDIMKFICQANSCKQRDQRNMWLCGWICDS